MSRTRLIAGAVAAAAALALLVWWYQQVDRVSVQDVTTRSGVQNEQSPFDTPGAQPGAEAGEGSPAEEFRPRTGPGAETPTPGFAVVPAEQGEPLARIDTPPPRTLVLLSPKAARAGERYEVGFRPYGIGPAANMVVVRVIDAKPSDGGSGGFELEDRNIVFVMSRAAAQRVTTGGTYRGEIELRETQEALQAFLVGAQQL